MSVVSTRPRTSWRGRNGITHLVSAAEYSDYFEFRGHRYPRKLALYENGVRLLRAEVVQLAATPLDPERLVPPRARLSAGYART